MNVSPTTGRSDKPRSSRVRLLVLCLLGAVAIGVGLGVRRSGWAKERQLRSLSPEQLALAIHDQPNDALTFVYYGSALMKAGNLADSENAFQRAVHLDPRLVSAQLGLAGVLQRENKLRQAKDAFEATIKLDPKEANAYMGLSQVYFQAGSPKMAIDPLKKFTELEPKNPLGWYYLGKLYGDAHQPELAMEALKKATTLQPKQADFWRDLGQVTGYYNHFAEAEQAYKTSLALSPHDAATHYLLGTLYLSQNDTPALRAQAEQELKAALLIDANMQKAYFALGQVYERSTEWKKAVLYYGRARDLDLSDYQALYHLGFCMVKAGKDAEGKKLIAASQALGTARREIDDLNNRIIADPQNRDLHRQLGRSYQKYGNAEGALTQYNIYQRMGGSDPAVAKEVAKLQAAQPQGLPSTQSSSPTNSGAP